MNEKFLFEMLQNLPYYSKLGVKVWGDMKIDFDTGGNLASGRITNDEN